MNLMDKVHIPEEVLARQVGEEAVMLHLEKGAYFGLDPIGARIWQLLSSGATLAEACDAIEREYEAPRAEIERDLLALVGELIAQGLVRPA